jgi:hypothetical protein
MSALGQQLPRRGQIGMSALPPKAAAAVADRRVRFGPNGDIRVGVPDSSSFLTHGERLNLQNTSRPAPIYRALLGGDAYRNQDGRCKRVCLGRRGYPKSHTI